MANAFVTAKTIAERALPHLVEGIKMLGLVQSGVYDSAFTNKSGDTIQIRKPQRGSVVDGSGDISGSIQALSDESVEMTLNIQDTYPVEMTSKEQALSVDDFERQVIIPAVTKIAESINENLLGLGVDIPYFYGTSGTTPDALEDIANPRAIMVKNLAPAGNRSFVFDPDAEAKFLQLDSLVEVDKSGTTAALRDAVIGRVYDILMVSDTMVPTHTAGLYSALTDVIGVGTAGDTDVTLESAAGVSTATLLKGDLFTLDGYQYVVTANTASASSGDIATVNIYPALQTTVTTDAVTFADVTAGAHVDNLMFQKDAFAIAMGALPEQAGVDNATISFDGFSIRVVSSYDFYNDKGLVRFDVLYGVKTTYPELAVRVLG